MQDIDSAVATYLHLSERWFTHASPTLFNAGTPRPQLSSCFLIAMKASEDASSSTCLSLDLLRYHSKMQANFHVHLKHFACETFLLLLAEGYA